MEIHIVEAGETVAGIAGAYGIAASLLIQLNGIIDGRLSVGQALLIARPQEQHTVRAGETLFSIAAAYQTNVQALYRNNPQLQGAPLIYPGQTLIIRYEGSPDRELTVGGYAYPFIDRSLLRATLPYLSLLAVFTYGFTADGALVGLNDDEELVNMALIMGTRPYMVLAPLTAEGQFNNDLVSAVLRDQTARLRLISEVFAVLEEKNYQGLDLDFEYVKAEDAGVFIAFAQELSPLLRAGGYGFNIALAPKYYAAQRGLLYEGHDYPELGRAADSVLLMTYEWGYSYGPPLAVAPIDEVRRVAEYGLSEIAAEKILLGIPNYGYDWTLPYQEGRRARTVGDQQALEIAWDNQAVISFDEQAMAPYFHYYTPEGVEHVVWFEDVRSILAKLELVDELGLSGISYWTVMRPFTQNWMLLDLLYQIRR